MHACLLVGPALLFVAVFLFLPTLSLFTASVMTQNLAGDVGGPVTGAHFLRLLDTPLYRHVLGTTLSISLWTAALSAVIGFPVAMVIARGRPWVSRWVNIIVITPLVVSVVVRAYGWQLLLANGPNGVLNVLLHSLGFGPAASRLLYTETAVVIGSLHLFLAMMVLPLVSSIARIPRSLEEAARTLGAGELQVFFRVVLPLCLPGLSTGLTLVFSLTASSFVLPVMLGGNKARMLGSLLEEQATAVFDWPFSAAIAVVMVAAVFLVNAMTLLLLRKQLAGRTAAPVESQP